MICHFLPVHIWVALQERAAGLDPVWHCNHCQHLWKAWQGAPLCKWTVSAIPFLIGAFARQDLQHGKSSLLQILMDKPSLIPQTADR